MTNDDLVLLDWLVDHDAERWGGAGNAARTGDVAGARKAIRMALLLDVPPVNLRREGMLHPLHHDIEIRETLDYGQSLSVGFWALAGGVDDLPRVMALDPAWIQLAEEGAAHVIRWSEVFDMARPWVLLGEELRTNWRDRVAG